MKVVFGVFEEVFLLGCVVVEFGRMMKIFFGR